MKKISCLLFMALLVASCKNDNNITIKGSYADGANEFIKVEMLTGIETRVIDSVKVSSSGKFKTSFTLSSPELVLLKNSAGEYINLLAFPGDQIELEIPQAAFTQGYTVSGSEESQKIKTLVDRVEITKFQLDSLSKAYDALEDKEGAEAEILVSAYQKTIQKQKRNNIRFVVENINSLSSVYALYQRIAPEVYVLNDLKDLQYFKIVADSVKVKYPESTLTASLLRDVEQRLREYNSVLTMNEFSKENIIETGLINLTIQNTEGNQISLGSLKGKVVLLSFWASWDKSSREANRQLKSIYERYRNRGFEVYAVALENDRNTWRTAIEFEEYNWINVCELTYPYSYAATAYNVTSLPTNFLIDKEGNIVAKNISGNVLATWLDNLVTN